MRLYVQQVSDLLNNSVDFIIIIHHVDIDDVFCLLVVRLAKFQLLMDKLVYLFRCFVEQQRAYAFAHLQMSVKGLWRCLQVKRFAKLVHVVHIVEETWCSSSATYHYIFKLCHFV